MHEHRRLRLGHEAAVALFYPGVVVNDTNRKINVELHNGADVIECGTRSELIEQYRRCTALTKRFQGVQAQQTLEKIGGAGRIKIL